MSFALRSGLSAGRWKLIAGGASLSFRAVVRGLLSLGPKTGEDFGRKHGISLVAPEGEEIAQDELDDRVGPALETGKIPVAVKDLRWVRANAHREG